LASFAGGSKIEAQTPDGTHVATPILSKDGLSASTSHQTMSNKASHAAALKAKPSDWHLQFSMDDHILPLDLTAESRRSTFLNWRSKSLNCTAPHPSVLEVEYFEEAGTGLGPTLEFYSLVSKNLHDGTRRFGVMQIRRVLVSICITLMVFSRHPLARMTSPMTVDSNTYGVFQSSDRGTRHRWLVLFQL
jgi:hypothetical protein